MDAAKLFNASIAIAKQHVTLRSQQLDFHGRTSSLVKAVNSQTDRVTLTAKAAIALTQRLNETKVPTSASSGSSSTHESRQNDAATLTAASSQKGPASVEERKQEGLEQDHHYEPSEANAVDEPLPETELKVRQDAPKRQTLPDGTIPSPAARVGLPDRGRDTYSQRPQPEPAKEPLAEKSEKVESLQPMSSDASTILPLSNRSTTEHEQNMESSLAGREEAGMEAINTNVFRTSRISNMLGNARSPVKATGSPEPGKAAVAAAEPDTRDFAHAISKEVDTTESLQVQVSDYSSILLSQAKDTDSLTAQTQIKADVTPVSERAQFQMRQSRVPSSRLGRMWQYGELATSLAFGAVGERFRQATGAGVSSGSLLLSPRNVERLVAKLSRMRGAALKIGQMISFQGV